MEKRFSPSLMRFLGWVFFFLTALGVFFLMSKIFGIDFSPHLPLASYGAKGVIAFIIASLLAVFIGMPTGFYIAAQIEVNDEANFRISAFWHFIANGSIVWIFAWMIYILIIGKEKIEGFFLANILLFVVPIIGFSLLVSFFLVTKILNKNYEPKRLVALTFFIPLTMWMCHFQQTLFLLKGIAWIVMGIIIPIIVLPMSIMSIRRDAIGRATLKDA